MAEKIVIEIYKTKTADELTKLIADPDSRLDTGSAAAMDAATAAALLCRAAAICQKTQSGERLDYIQRNADKIREYMIYLIDEDVKARAPMKKHIADGSDERTLEASRQVAVSITNEIVNMMGNSLDLMRELSDIAVEDAKRFIAEAAHTALAAMKCASSYTDFIASRSRDETYRFVAKRENEISIEQYTAVYDEIIARCK